MARLRAAAPPRHPGVDRAWLELQLPELERLVNDGQYEAAVRLGEAMQQELDSRRGCGPRRGTWRVDACPACHELDEAHDAIALPYYAARCVVPAGPVVRAR